MVSNTTGDPKLRLIHYVGSMGQTKVKGLFITSYIYAALLQPNKHALNFRGAWVFGVRSIADSERDWKLHGKPEPVGTNLTVNCTTRILAEPCKHPQAFKRKKAKDETMSHGSAET